MNVYLFELKDQAKNAAAYTAVLLALLFALMVVVYPIYFDSRFEVKAIIEGFPPEFAAAFGMEMGDIFSFEGFYAFCFLYISLIGGTMAATMGLSIFAREKRSKCTDFLLTKPISRLKVFGAKLLAALTLLGAANALFIAAFALVYGGAGQEAALMGNVLLCASTLFFTQLVILAISVFVAVFIKKIRLVSGGAMAIGFGCFVLTALHSVLKEDVLRYIAPYKYFDVIAAYNTGGFEPRYAVAAAVLTVGLLAASAASYCRSDVHSV